MSLRGILTVATPALIALGANAVPVVGLVFGGWPPTTAMVVYLAETLLIVAVTALRIRLLGPLRWVTKDGRQQTRAELISGFAILGGGFSLASGIFLLAITVMAGMLDLAFTGQVVGPSLLGLAFFQLLGLLADMVLLGQVDQARAEAWLRQSLGRVFLIYLAVFAGAFLAIFFQANWFVGPFIGLKIMVDVGGPIELALNQRRGTTATEESLQDLPGK